MAQATLSVRIDSDDKSKFETFCQETGMNVSVAINMYIKNVLREKKLPFEITTISSDPFYSETNMARLKKSIEQMEKTGGTIHEVDYDD